MRLTSKTRGSLQTLVCMRCSDGVSGELQYLGWTRVGCPGSSLMSVKRRLNTRAGGDGFPYKTNPKDQNECDPKIPKNVTFLDYCNGYACTDL